MYDISFPKIGIYLNNIPDGITIFGIEIKFYGIIIAIGVLLAYMIASKEAKRTGQNPELYLDYVLVGIIPAIVCARLYYVIFSWSYYFAPGDTIGESLLKVINIRQGGLAIYGGLIGGILACWIFTRVRKVSFLNMMDTIAIGIPLAQLLGRWGNFFNREAFGTYTDSLLAMAIPLEYYEKKGLLSGLEQAGVITDEMLQNTVNGCIWVQPTFLYESLWNLGLFIFLMIWRKHKKFHGELLAIYVGGYGLGRFWIEGLRTDPLMLGNTGLRVSQVLAICLVVGAVICYVIGYRNWKKKNEIQNTTSSGE